MQIINLRIGGQHYMGGALNQRCLLFLMGAIALIALPHAWHMPWPLFGFFSLLVVWRVLAIWNRHWLPKGWLLYLLTFSGISLLVMQHRGLFGRDAGTSLFMVALGLKLMEIRGQRDVFLVVCLAFIVAASQFLYEQSIAMAAYIFLVCVALLAILITQMAVHVSSQAALKTASAIILQALPLTALIFVMFPRLEAPRWMWLKDDNKALSGLSNTLEPGSISDLSLSDELVFRVRFKGELPPPALRYWRGPVYTKTDGSRWFAADKNTDFAGQLSFSGPVYSYTLLMEPQKQDWVFALDMPESIDASLRRDADLLLHTQKRFSERAEYLITSRSSYRAELEKSADYAANLQLPAAPSTKQIALVRELRGFDSVPEAFIQNLLNYFRQEAFFYTLTPPLMPDEPIDTFLFETRSGFCSHYATAFVYLLRVANIPARVVGGYQGGAINEVGGFLEVRQADAHAWAEVWLQEKGWVRFDPTAAIAPERIERGVDVDLQIERGVVSFSPGIADSGALNWIRRSRQLWQSIDYNWQRWVINYNAANQAQFLTWLGIGDITALLKALVAGVLVIVLPLAWWVLREKTKPTEQVLRYYKRFCRKLAKAGINIRDGEGPKDFCVRAEAMRPDLAAQINEITTLFIRLRYQNDAKADDLKRLKTSIVSLRV